MTGFYSEDVSNQVFKVAFFGLLKNNIFELAGEGIPNISVMRLPVIELGRVICSICEVDFTGALKEVAHAWNGLSLSRRRLMLNALSAYNDIRVSSRVKLYFEV